MAADWRRTKKGKAALAAAEDGDTAAMRRVAWKLASLDREDDVARMWLLRAVDAGDAEALTDLALLIEKEAGIDASAALYWQQACEAGSPRALHTVGCRANLEGNTSAASTLWLRAAANGYVASMHNLAVLAEKEGRETDADRWYSEAAELGDRECAFRLGVREADRSNLEEAVRRFDQACTLTVHAAARYHRPLIREFQGDVSAAVADLQLALEMGLDLAAVRIAMHESAMGSSPKAREMYLRAVHLGERDPQYQSRDHALGVTPQAEKWARDPRQQGHAGAHMYLGYWMIHHGDLERAHAEFEPS